MSERLNKPETNVAERIAQLSEIDRDVAKLLQSVGSSIKTLTVAVPESEETQERNGQNIEQKKKDFATASSHYFSLLSSIDVRLRRQISALEEAEIIPSETTTKDSQASADTSTSTSRSAAPNKSIITNGGLGNLDVGWLNSRNDNIDKIMEAELWEKAQKLIQKELENTIGATNDVDIAMGNESATSLE